MCLFYSLLGDIDIGPARKFVLFIPLALAVAQEYNFVHFQLRINCMIYLHDMIESYGKYQF